MRANLLSLCIAFVLACGTGGALAASSSSTGPMPVTGAVPALCSVGPVATGTNVFAVGTLVDTATGLILPALAPAPKTITASFCNTLSTITVSATPMTAQSFTPPPPAGFSSGVNYTATASGWTTAAASFTTGAAANPTATQSRTTAFTGDFVITLTGFSTVGGNALRLVADPVYQGNVTVTLAAGT